MQCVNYPVYRGHHDLEEGVGSGLIMPPLLSPARPPPQKGDWRVGKEGVCPVSAWLFFNRGSKSGVRFRSMNRYFLLISLFSVHSPKWHRLSKLSSLYFVNTAVCKSSIFLENKASNTCLKYVSSPRNHTLSCGVVVRFIARDKGALMG